jgi:hypothetical protein
VTIRSGERTTVRSNEGSGAATEVESNGEFSRGNAGEKAERDRREGRASLTHHDLRLAPTGQTAVKKS